MALSFDVWVAKLEPRHSQKLFSSKWNGIAFPLVKRRSPDSYLSKIHPETVFMVSYINTLKFRKQLNRFIAVVVLFALLFLACLGYAYFIEPRRLVITRSELKIKGWNPAFDGLKILMIGDVHGGSHYVTEEKLREVVAMTNEQEADIVVLLGDYVAQFNEEQPVEQRSLRMPIETIAAGLAGINSKYGVFAVLGNHDGWAGDQKIAAALSGNGYRVLQNEIATVEKDGGHLRILGFKDHLKLGSWKQVSDDSKELLANTGDGEIIALEHSPDIVPMITGDLSISPDLKLILAAHTHGGQVWLPIFGRPIVPSIFGQKYAYGHVKENDVDIWVTSGVGISVLPIRFMVPPEIAVLTIRSDKN